MRYCWPIWYSIILAIGLAGASATNADDPRAVALAKEVRDKGWIAYSARSPQRDWDLFLCRPDGSKVRDITNSPEVSEAAPRFSPDGKKLLYRRFPKDTKINHDKWGFKGELVIANADGTNATVLGKDGEFPWASWSPDGKRIACLTLKGITIVDVATNEVVGKLPRKGMYQQLTWSSDGQAFCGVSNNFGEMWTVVRMDAKTGEMNPVNAFQNCTPDWFPDSRRMIFSHRPKQTANKGYGWTQLWMADADGTKRRLVYGEDGRHVYGGATSPDGEYVLFTSCPQDGGGSEKDGAPMGLMRFADVPTITGESKDLRKVHPDTKDGPVLSLPVAWEPHWTYADVVTAP